MKNVRKIISCLLCFILLLCCSSGTLAADTDGTLERVAELAELLDYLSFIQVIRVIV